MAADKSTRLEAAPHCLQICLKRFAPGRFGKITTKLSFPEEEVRLRWIGFLFHFPDGCCARWGGRGGAPVVAGILPFG